MNDSTQVNLSETASKIRGPFLNLSLILLSAVCYTGAILLTIVWDLNIFLYLVVAFIISCLLGAVAVDIKKSIILAYVSMILGSVAATAIFLAPHALFSRNPIEFDYAAISLFTVLAKIILLGLIVYFLGALVGAYLGEKALQRTKR
jgi:hypothetical protein